MRSQPRKENAVKIDGINSMFCLTVLLVTAAIPAGAETSEQGLSQSRVQIVGHISFGERSLVDIALTTAGGRRYVYVQHSQDEGVSIVEVTNTSQPTLLASVFWPDGAELGQFTFLGDYAIGNGLPSGAGIARSRRGIVVWSLRHDPRPSDALGFRCVTRAIVDQKQIYVLNDAGLWIVEAPAGHTIAVSFMGSVCTTAIRRTLQSQSAREGEY
jgi:hypothetical protein